MNERREAEEHLRRVRVELAAAEQPWLGGRKALRILVVFVVTNALLGGGWTCVITGMVGSDPLFGAHADMLCPRLCEGCTGPYGFQATTTIQGNSARTDAIFCRDPEGRFRTVRGGIWFISLTMMACTPPLALMIVVFLAVQGRRSYIARRDSRRRAVARAERALTALE